MSFTGKIKPQSLASGRPSANARGALEWVEKNSPLGEIIQKAENTLKLQGAIAHSLQKNGLEKAVDWVKIGSFHAGELKLHTDHAGISSRILQKAPSIVANLQEMGLPVQRIVIRQTPGNGLNQTSHPSPPASAKPLSAAARTSFEKLLNSLDRHSSLYQAVKKILQR